MKPHTRAPLWRTKLVWGGAGRKLPGTLDGPRGDVRDPRGHRLARIGRVGHGHLAGG